nr:zinc finger protein 185 isoform X1 [Paramormyrops kingsleyae]
MSKEGDRQSVLRTTKVRTSLKGDSSWIQSRSEPQPEQQKSWLAQVKATPPISELSPPPSPTAASAATDPSSPTTTQAPTPSSGYLIRGVFTKTNNEKAPASNGTSSPSGTFLKKPTDSYKKIAPHIVRSGSSSSYLDDGTLSSEEQDKRTEAASNVLKSSASRQRSYVLSAAKKYESVEKPQDAGLPFVAKRVVIDDEDDISHKDKGMDNTAPPVGSQQTAAQSVLPSSSVETPKVPPPSAPAPVVSTSPKESKPVVEQKTETPAVKSSSVEMPKVPPAVVPAPVVPTSTSKDAKPVEDLKKTETPAVKACSPAKAEQAPKPRKNLDNQDLISLAESGEKFLDPLPSVPESHKTQIDQKTSISLDTLADDVIPFGIKSISSSDSAKAKEPITTQRGTEQKAREGPSSTQTVTTSVTKIISTDPSPLKEPPKSSDISVMDLFDPFPVDPNKRSTTPVSPLKRTEDSFEEDLNDLCDDQENFSITVEKIEPHNPSPSPMDSSFEATSQKATPSETESKKGIVLLKEYVNTKPATGISNNDLFSGDYISSSVSSYNYSSPTSISSTSSACTYCGLPVGSEAKITIEHLNISCHPACFKCGMCGKPMGDLLYSMFLHKGVVHCESCYANTI